MRWHLLVEQGGRLAEALTRARPGSAGRLCAISLSASSLRCSGSPGPCGGARSTMSSVAVLTQESFAEHRSGLIPQQIRGEARTRRVNHQPSAVLWPLRRCLSALRAHWWCALCSA